MKRLLSIFILLVLIATAIYLYYKDPYSTISSPQSDFSIVDTASIGKIFIATTQGTQALIERDGDRWRLNDKYQARQDAVNTILKTFRLIEIKHPVALNDREGILRLMAGRHTYVQVFNRNGEFIQAYYMGTMTADQRGTYMVLERPGIGRTEIPYVMTMKSFYGYLNSRFFTDELDWRDRIILRYPDLDINRVEVHNHLHPDRSFAIEYKRAIFERHESLENKQ